MPIHRAKLKRRIVMWTKKSSLKEVVSATHEEKK